LEYASDFLLGGSSASSEMENKSRPETIERPLQKQNKKDDTVMPQPAAVERAPTLEEDHRLVELATQAARSMHQIKGYEFDESYNINFPVDIQFSVVDLEMPLGLIFHENDNGCWVTKVLPNGSASKNGSVQNGDQLAAIDGVSAIHMKVCQIAAAIKDKNAAVELTFLRYAGPLHPTIGSIAEEGYEVRPKTKTKSLTGQLRKSTLVKQGVANDDNRHQAGERNMEQLTRKTGKQHEPKPQPEKRRFRLFGRRK
jgi:C-terminal processing protease CtpA/Prc